MKKKEWNQGLDYIDYDLVEKYTLQKEKLKGRQHTKSVWFRVGALAACLVLIFGAVVFLPRLQNDVPSGSELNGSTNDSTIKTPDDKLNDHIHSYQKLAGISSQFIVDFSTSIRNNGASAEMEDTIVASDRELWGFRVKNFFTVKAKIVGEYTDEYYDVATDEYYDVANGGDYESRPYRLVKMEILEAINTENMPQYFLYLVPSKFYVDMSVYDSLLISMWQRGTENYVLKNVTQNQMESFDLPVFGTLIDNWFDFGNIIAFREGVFDETLWQTESWEYGYRFGKEYLDDPEDDGRSVVKRGDTEEDVIAKIKQKIAEQNAPTQILRTFDFQTQEAKDVLEFVKPFDNGVFTQELSYLGDYGGTVKFRRYINGCPTQETITIDLATEKVTYSDVRYTTEDIETMEDISVHLADMAKEYSQNIPQPPHLNAETTLVFDITDAELVRLKLSAWYVKVDGKLYGIIETVWIYETPLGVYTGWSYDTAYILFDMSAKTKTEIEHADLIEIVGTWNIRSKPYSVFYLIRS